MNDKKLAIIIGAVTKMFMAVGKNPDERMVTVFSEILMPYDINCLLTSIQDYTLSGDGWPTVAKILNIYESRKKVMLIKKLEEVVMKAKNNQATGEEVKALMYCNNMTGEEISQRDIYNDYKANEEYFESRLRRFMELFKEDVKEIDIKSDIFSLTNAQELIG